MQQLKTGDRVKGYGDDCPKHSCGCPFGTVKRVSATVVHVQWDGTKSQTMHRPDGLKRVSIVDECAAEMHRRTGL